VGFTASTGWYADAHEVPKFKFLGWLQQSILLA